VKQLETAHGKGRAVPGQQSLEVVADEISFKLKLGIGDALLRKLKAREHLSTFAEAMGVGTTASAVAASTTVAAAFAPAPGAALGLAGVSSVATLATPLPWIIGAGIAASSAYIGVARWLDEGDSSDEWLVVPKQQGTPLDLIGASLLDLMLPLSQSFAIHNGKVVPELETMISRYYVDQWGYSPEYYAIARVAVADTDRRASAERLTNALLEFSNSSGDCHTPALLSDLEAHLEGLVAHHPDRSAQECRLGDLKESVFYRFSTKPSRLQRLGGRITLVALSAGELAKRPLSGVRSRLRSVDQRLRNALLPFR
jgi:hypothetical protein